MPSPTGRSQGVRRQSASFLEPPRTPGTSIMLQALTDAEIHEQTTPPLTDIAKHPPCSQQPGYRHRPRTGIQDPSGQPLRGGRGRKSTLGMWLSSSGHALRRAVRAQRPNLLWSIRHDASAGVRWITPLAAAGRAVGATGLRDGRVAAHGHHLHPRSISGTSTAGSGCARCP